MRTIVTDGNERSALAVTRALGQQGIRVLVGAETRSSLAGSSRYCTESFVYPNPYADPTGFTACMVETIQKTSIDVVFPITDIAMQLIGMRKQEFDLRTNVPMPPLKIFQDVSDKYHLMELATLLGVPIPETVFIPDGHLGKVIDRIHQYPVVVKPARSLIENQGLWQKTGVHHAANPEELRQLYHEQPYLQGRSLIQQRVMGAGQGLFVMMNQGEPVAVFAHKRLRERPPSGGVSVLRESIEPPKHMTDYALRLLRHVGWHGVAMVEFKMESHSDLPLLMEINGRFWGSLQLAIDAGANFPFMLYQMASGQPISLPISGYRVGVKSRWLWGDVDHLLLRFLKPERQLHLPPGSPSKWMCVVDFCRFFQKDLHYEIERLDDPSPCAYEFLNYFRSLARRA